VLGLTGLRTGADATIAVMSVEDGTRRQMNARRPTLRERQWELVAEYEAEHGPIPQRLLDELDAAWAK
jgi:hypothetical protein